MRLTGTIQPLVQGREIVVRFHLVQRRIARRGCLTEQFEGAIGFAAERQHPGDFHRRAPLILATQALERGIRVRVASERVLRAPQLTGQARRGEPAGGVIRLGAQGRRHGAAAPEPIHAREGCLNSVSA
jgi:hypothetical protein